MSDKNKDNKNKNLDGAEKNETEKFENHDELIARVNKKLRAVEKRINQVANEHGDYVKVYFDFNEVFGTYDEGPTGSGKKESRNPMKYIYTLEIYSPYKDEGEVPQIIIETYPDFKTAKEYEDDANIKVIEDEFIESLYEEYVF